MDSGAFSAVQHKESQSTQISAAAVYKAARVNYAEDFGN
jgi:hypothetical protein